MFSSELNREVFESELNRKVFDELGGRLCLTDYLGRSEAVELFNNYEEEHGEPLDVASKIDLFAFVNWANGEGEDLRDLYERALSEAIDSAVIYYSDCVDILQADLLEALELLEEYDNENGGEGLGWSAPKLAACLLYQVATTSLNYELMAEFIRSGYKEVASRVR